MISPFWSLTPVVLHYQPDFIPSPSRANFSQVLLVNAVNWPWTFSFTWQKHLFQLGFCIGLDIERVLVQLTGVISGISLITLSCFLKLFKCHQRIKTSKKPYFLNTSKNSYWKHNFYVWFDRFHAKNFSIDVVVKTKSDRLLTVILVMFCGNFSF